MQNLKALEPQSATGKIKELFDAINSKLGMVPNMMRTMGNSPAVLAGYLEFSATLGGGKLGMKTGELIALTVANANSCEYCNAAHSLISEKMVNIDLATINDARSGKSTDPKVAAALVFARTLLEKKGLVTSADVDLLKQVGFDDGEIAEIIAHVALNLFTNYFNNAAKVVVDFPMVELVKAVAI